MTHSSIDAPHGVRLPVGARQWVHLLDIPAPFALPATFQLLFFGSLTVPADHVLRITHVHLSVADLTNSGGSGTAYDAGISWSLTAGERQWIENGPVQRFYVSGKAIAANVDAFVWCPTLPLVVQPLLLEGHRATISLATLAGFADACIGFATGWLAPISKDLARELGVD